MSQQHIVDITVEIKQLWKQYDESKEFRKSLYENIENLTRKIKQLQTFLAEQEKLVILSIKESDSITDQIDQTIIRLGKVVNDQNE